MTPPRATRLVFGDCVLDLASQQLWRAGQPVQLPPRIYAVLVHLLDSAGRLVEQEALLQAVWGHLNVSDSALKVAINAVRAALGDSTKAPRYIETLPRRGYRFICEVQTAQALPAANEPPATAPRKGNLPAVLPGLVGREHDLPRLQAALALQRLVTLHGPGGVGKTRLALAAAGTAPPADGVWLVRLEALADAAPLLATVARTLGLGAGAEGDAAALARAMGKLRLRLVIDNAEHLHEAVAELVSAVLDGAPGVQMLVTSQVPLHVMDEQLLPLSPLPVPDDESSAEPTGALRLLLERVQQQAPDLLVDGAARADALAICRALDGLPLALELAAARVPLLGWAGVRARLDEQLDERLQLLTRGRRDAPERHRTLRAALDWACGLLSPAELATLQALSVFAGPFTVDAAIAVAAAAAAGTANQAADDLLDILDRLRERSLLVRAHDGSVPRWRLYDSVRSHAAQGLRACGGELAALQRLLQHLTQHFEAADIDFGRMPLHNWLRDLQPEVDTLRAALNRAWKDPALHAAGAALFAASTVFRVRGGWRREALIDYTTIQSWPTDERATWSPATQAAMDLAVAQLVAPGQMLPPEQGLQAVRRAQVYLEHTGDMDRLHGALQAEAAILVRMQGPLDWRQGLVDRMAQIERPDWTPLQRRNRLWQQVMLLRDRGELAEFEARARDYVAMGRTHGDANAAWVGAQGLAQVLVSQQRLDEATTLLADTVAEQRACGELRSNVQVLAQLAALRIMADVQPDTVALLREAADLLQAEGRLWWLADALPWLPAGQGRWEDAVKVQAWADGLVRERGEPRGRLFGTLRQRFQQRLQEQPEAARWLALLDAAQTMTEFEVRTAAFGH